MKKLRKGEYFGSHYQKLSIDNIIITDTEYTLEKVDWHYHENPYFTYLIQGELFEANKKESYALKSGSLLFHNMQDAHYNIKSPKYTRGFHIELNSNWFKMNDFDLSNIEGSIHLKDPKIVQLINRIFLETKLNDLHTQISIDVLLMELFNQMNDYKVTYYRKQPKWVAMLIDIIEANPNANFSLTKLSQKLNIHPVHLSRDFSKYFGSTLGTYIRMKKVNKALLLIVNSKMSMTEICYTCGFYDQSHFILNFKKMYKTTPTHFLKLIS